MKSMTKMSNTKNLFSMSRGYSYFDQGGYGVSLESVREYRLQKLNEIDKNPSRYFNGVFQDDIERLRESIAAYFQLEPNNFIFTNNATSSFNFILTNLKLRPGDHILMNSTSYTGIKRAVERSAPNCQIDLEFFDDSQSATEIARDIRSKIKESTRLIACDHMTVDSCPLERFLMIY